MFGDSRFRTRLAVGAAAAVLFSGGLAVNSPTASAADVDYSCATTAGATSSMVTSLASLLGVAIPPGANVAGVTCSQVAGTPSLPPQLDQSVGPGYTCDGIQNPMSGMLVFGQNCTVN